MAPSRRCLAGALLLAAALLLVQGAAPAAARVVNLEVLIWTSPGFTNIDFLQSIMQGLGVRYSVLYWDAAAGLNVTSLLYNADGSAKYAGIVMYPNLEAMGPLNSTQVQQLWAYQRATGARTVKFGAWPTNVGFNVDTSQCSSADAPLALTADAPLGYSGIKRTAPLTVGGLYRCPGVKAQPLGTCNIWAADFAATGLPSACTSKSVVDIGTTYTAGALVSYADGRESLAFMHDCAGWTPTCLALGHVSIDWLLRGVMPGERNALLTVEMDDFFLATEFDPGYYVGSAREYRSSPQDLSAHVTWQNNLNTALGAGSAFRLDFPFNAQGVLAAVEDRNPDTLSVPLDIDDRSCLDLPDYITLGCNCWFVGTGACPTTAPAFCRNCTKDWAKPLGYGRNRAPAGALTSSSTWSATEFAANDPLTALVMSSAKNDFFFCHHTYSHENLDNVTRYDADVQIKLNIDMANTLGLSTLSTFSSRCMVTPQISGLRNGDALAALSAGGITCAAGDNTWPFLLNQANPYHMLYTTVGTNGFDGFAILPRFATEIYYNCSVPSQNEALYNRLYSSFYGGPSTINDIVSREATRVVRDGLLKLRHDPYMMHQANVGILDGSGKSLVMRWVEAVTGLFRQFADWPIASLSMDQLYTTYSARQTRDACDLSYSLDVGADGSVAGVTVTSLSAGAGTCGAPLLVKGAASTVSVPRGGSAGAALTGVTWAPQA